MQVRLSLSHKAGPLFQLATSFARGSALCLALALESGSNLLHFVEDSSSVRLRPIHPLIFSVSYPPARVSFARYTFYFQPGHWAVNMAAEPDSLVDSTSLRVIGELSATAISPTELHYI